MKTWMYSTLSGVCGTINIALAEMVSTEVREWILFAFGVCLYIVALLPYVIKLISKIINALKDGKVTQEELEDIKDSAKELKDKIDETKEKTK